MDKKIENTQQSEGTKGTKGSYVLIYKKDSSRVPRHEILNTKQEAIDLAKDMVNDCSQEMIIAKVETTIVSERKIKIVDLENTEKKEKKIA